MSVIKSGTLINDSQGKIIHTKIGETIAIDYQPASIVDHDDFKHLSVDCSQEYFSDTVIPGRKCKKKTGTNCYKKVLNT